MEMCYDGALVMPSNYAVMSEDEMMYVDGGKKITINRSTITSAVKSVFGWIGAGFTIYTLANLIRSAAPAIAKFVLAAGPLTQAAAVILTDFIAVGALTLAVIYLSGGSVSFNVGK